jgi:WD40 repeat protein
MTTPAFKDLERLFHEAVALPADQRPTFLDDMCVGNTDLRAAVEELLRHDGATDEADTFLSSPVAPAAAHLRPEAPTLKDVGRGQAAPAGPPLPDIHGYEILGELGRGGMGVVYKARQSSLNRVVALKMLLPFGADAPEMLARFRTEVEALARLQLPNIVAVYEVGEQDGRPYFTMEYVPGPSLAEVLDGRPQPVTGSARLIEVLARTMHAVHQRGIIHRDLKPANILLASSEGVSDEATDTPHRSPLTTHHSPLTTHHPKITDFGLAKDQTDARKLTQSGTAMGTPCYMAPEQARSKGRGVGPAADIYALGAILYEMLTGRPPFEAATAAETITELLHDEPLSPSRLRPKLPRDLTTICLKCLEKASRKRYASAWELAEDLRRFLAGEPIRARPVGLVERTVRWCRRRPMVAALLALSSLLAVGLIVTVLVYDSWLEAALAQAQGLSEEERQQIVQLNVNIGLTALDQGDTFAAVLRFTEALRLDEGVPERERNHRMRIATALQQCPRLLDLRVLDRRVLCTQMGTDGGWMATVDTGRRLEVCDVLTGRLAGPALALDDTPVGGAISPDGRSLVTLGTHGATRVWDLATGKSEELSCREGQAVQRAVFHPDGRILLTQHEDSVIRLWDLTTRPLGSPRLLSGGAVRYAALSDDARWLFAADANHMGQVWDAATGQTLGGPVRLESEVSLAAVSPLGRRLVLLGPDKTLRVWDVAKSRWLGSAIQAGRAVSRVVFSPDAERVITCGSTLGFQEWQVQTGALVAISSPHRSVLTDARFSADGRLVATMNGAGLGRVWDAATGQALTPPLGRVSPLVGMTVCADGKRIATVSRSGTVVVWELPRVAEMPGDRSADKGLGTAGEATLGGGARRIKLGDGTTVQVTRALTGAHLSPPRLGMAS